MSLYKISEDYLYILAQLEENGGELTADLESQLTAVEGSLEGKAENICKAYQSLTAEAEAFKVESKRLAEQGKAREKTAERLKQYLKERLEVMGMDKLKAGLFTLAIQKNPPSIDWVELPCRIPAKYLVPQEPKLDKRLALADWKAGELVNPDGWEISTDKTNLRIK